MQFNLTHQSHDEDDAVEVVSLGSLDDLTDLINDKEFPIMIFKDRTGAFDTEYVMVVVDGD